MNLPTRRRFLADIGRGMFAATLGSAASFELGLAPALAGDAPQALTFGALEPLVALMQETSPDKLLPLLVDKLKHGTDLRTLAAAGALANARSFGGQDYTGYHALMAISPAFDMTRELPEEQRALPILKVLYRNSARIQEQGGRKSEVMHDLVAAEMTQEHADGETLRQATRKADMAGAEHIFAAMAKGPIGEAYNHLQFAIQDEVDVHRVVLAWRSWSLLDLTGPEQAQTLLRQAVRYCVKSEEYRLARKLPEPAVRAVLPKLFDQYRILSKPLGDRRGDDAWVLRLSDIIYGPSREIAADAVAAALSEGFSPECIGEAVSLAANQLVLRDPGRAKGDALRPVGSVHGASVGVHASDSANAWRHIARVSNPRNTAASLIVGAFHTAGQSGGLNAESFPLPAQLDKIEITDPAALLKEIDAAIQAKDQARACALVHRYGQHDYAERPVFDLLLRYAVSEDGALHAEKYYRTVSEEFASSRPAFRWRQLSALARVTASEYGFPAAGMAQARELLKAQG